MPQYSDLWLFSKNSAGHRSWFMTGVRREWSIEIIFHTNVGFHFMHFCCSEMSEIVIFIYPLTNTLLCVEYLVRELALYRSRNCGICRGKRLSHKAMEFMMYSKHGNIPRAVSERDRCHVRLVQVLLRYPEMDVSKHGMPGFFQLRSGVSDKGIAVDCTFKLPFFVLNGIVLHKCWMQSLLRMRSNILKSLSWLTWYWIRVCTHLVSFRWLGIQESAEYQSKSVREN